jgi:hypothetical protein
MNWTGSTGVFDGVHFGLPFFNGVPEPNLDGKTKLDIGTGVNPTPPPILPPLPPSPPTSAVYNVQSFPIDPNTTRGNTQPGQIFISNYGYPKDPYMDSGTRYGLGNRLNTLGPNSLALGSDLRAKWGASPGDQIFLDGRYLGNFDDTVPWRQTIDVYDPFGQLGTNWGGIYQGEGIITTKPPGQ